MYYFRSNLGYKELTKHKKATAQESISIESIRDAYIPIPPFAEQKSIIKKSNYYFLCVLICKIRGVCLQIWTYALILYQSMILSTISRCSVAVLRRYILVVSILSCPIRSARKAISLQRSKKLLAKR